MEDQPTRIMLTVSRSTIHGYPHPSISSREAFEFAMKKIVRSDTSRFKLHILHVLDSDDIDTWHERALKLLAYFDNRCREVGVKCESWIKGGHPTRVICHEAQRVRPDLLVLGSRNLGWFRRMFIRSVSDFCAKNCECAVLIVKRRARDTPENPADD